MFIYFALEIILKLLATQFSFSLLKNLILIIKHNGKVNFQLSNRIIHILFI